MLFAISAILGFCTESPTLWWIPAAAGMVGQIAHYAASPAYRRQLEVDGAIAAAVIAMMLLTVGCLLAFAAGRFLANAL